MSDVNAIIRLMESSIELITNKITESEMLKGEGPTCKSQSQKKLWEALYSLEETIKTMGDSPNESENRKNLNYKARVKELKFMITDLGNAWDDISN